MSECGPAKKLNAVDTIYLDDQRVLTFKEPFLDYADSDYGAFHFTQKLRFNPYRYDRMQMHQDLGDDVHPLLHMPHTHDQVLQPFLRAQILAGDHSQLNLENIHLLRQGAYFHDTGENEHPSLIELCGGITGDVDYRTKINATPEVRAKREENEQAIRQFFYERHLGYMTDDQLVKLERIVGDNHAYDYEKQLFDAVEHVGYFDAAIKAAEIALANLDKLDTKGRVLQLGRMAARVGIPWYTYQLTVADEYPYVASRLQENECIINSVIKHIEPNVDI